MTSGENPPRADYTEASSQLDEGLKVCRAVMNNYRAMLTGGLALNDSGEDQNLEAVTAANEDSGPSREMVDALGLEPRTR